MVLKTQTHQSQEILLILPTVYYMYSSILKLLYPHTMLVY